MREIVDAGEVLKIKVGVDLGGRDVGMTQQFLYAAQILARLEQMRCKGVAKEVRVDVHRQALFAGAIDAKDQLTSEHIRRLQIYATGLARAIGLPAREVQAIGTIDGVTVASEPGPVTARLAAAFRAALVFRPDYRHAADNLRDALQQRRR